jgi:hypothetical protein
MEVLFRFSENKSKREKFSKSEFGEEGWLLYGWVRQNL